ncbi:MFS transporter [Brevibacillus sp. H7]|uniref:MFS transporter n=1 Tax=Brevibacillus sp. H7 TaxID=3349138 RepID=UPI00380A88A8
MRALLFAILFLVKFDMNAQTPLLSPYMHLLGASTAMIGFVLGVYSISNLMGNILAGPILDRFVKKWFIGTGLLLSGVMLAGQGLTPYPEHFIWLRLALGFFMAFVSPACFAMLSETGRSPSEQGELMAKNGMVLTAAAIVSPGVGGFFAGQYGYAESFVILGGIMIAVGFLALILLPGRIAKGDGLTGRRPAAGLTPLTALLENTQIYPALVAGFAVLYAQGTILFEIPLFIQRQQLSPSVTGMLFSIMGIGSLAVLSQFWLQRTSPHQRTCAGLFLLSFLLYVLAIGWEFSLYVMMFLLGTCFGLLFPAMTTILSVHSPRELYGSVFSLFSAVLSLGAILSPIIAGMMDNWHHSFFLAFFVTMGTALLGTLHTVLAGRTSN